LPGCSLVFCYGRLIEGGGFPLFKGNGTGGADRKTVAQTITIIIPDKFCLTI
jgi:hypothetical protein